MELNLSVANNESIPYLDQYFGVWAISEPGANALISMAKSFQFSFHMESGSPEAAQAVADSQRYRSRDERGIEHIELRGSLMKHAGSSSRNTSTVLARRQIRTAANDSAVNAILLRIESPGGTVAGTHDLAAEIRKAKEAKPVYAFIEDCGCSAAYWLAAQADKIYANESALIGSIGVLSVVEDLSKAAEHEGIKVHVIKAGAMKGAGVPGTEVTSEQIAEWQKIVNAFYDDFVDAVAAGRNITRDAALALADARVHKGQAAVDLGLIDGISSLDATIELMVSEISRKRKAQAMTKADDTGKVEQDAGREASASAATIKQLNEAFADATADFKLSCISDELTIEQAKDRWIENQAAENKRLKEDLEKAKATKPTDEGKPRKPVGRLGIDSADEGTAEAEGSDLFVSQVREVMKATGKAWRAACYEVARRNPELQSAYRESCPPARPSNSR